MNQIIFVLLLVAALAEPRVLGNSRRLMQKVEEEVKPTVKNFHMSIVEPSLDGTSPSWLSGVSGVKITPAQRTSNFPWGAFRDDFSAQFPNLEQRGYKWDAVAGVDDLMSNRLNPTYVVVWFKSLKKPEDTLEKPKREKRPVLYNEVVYKLPGDLLLSFFRGIAPAGNKPQTNFVRLFKHSKASYSEAVPEVLEEIVKIVFAPADRVAKGVNRAAELRKGPQKMSEKEIKKTIDEEIYGQIKIKFKEQIEKMENWLKQSGTQELKIQGDDPKIEAGETESLTVEANEPVEVEPVEVEPVEDEPTKPQSHYDWTIAARKNPEDQKLRPPQLRLYWEDEENRFLPSRPRV